MSDLDFEDWGRIAYQQALAKQHELVDAVFKRDRNDTLVFCEHDPVVTLGRGAIRESSPVFGDLPTFHVERGGLATYHGPGQLVGYPILRLSPKSESLCPGGIRELVCRMETAIIELLTAYNVSAGRIPKKTGVWIDGERKIASIGIAVSHWISFHGFALNLSTDKTHWRLINPCGFSSEVMTNLCEETTRSVDLKKIKQELKDILFDRLLCPSKIQNSTQHDTQLVSSL